ncbi:D-ornithine 4,5-aminomutase S subunit [Caloramator quimbayensis]|uniref:D-ornithine 4,5-aminomutase S subunit n=1 Tax=Caloramator quimbayensis TaxID=1147123 RepID=A0A1T4WW83_9CLOT|nr:ornithine aminomutase subunit alpha [Caloramator quimbayensis]SKA81564.1 D-ornithine 4,5-aminomutase S subunit [Caloramator quimbayensis]
MPIKRADDYEVRREHLKNLTDEELEERFWALAEKIVDPLVELARNNTTPSIERSVLLRMGFSSLEAKDIVNNTIDRGLMGKGAGNVVLKVSKKLSRDYREVGREMAQGLHWDLAVNIFKGGEK